MELAHYVGAEGGAVTYAAGLLHLAAYDCIQATH